ncbi:MAG: hypothetical protein K0A93_00290 [Desulfuromonadaceae bacterium]|nr:hypothetical protein [Desulfuromonadaceae bacterium]
MQEQLHTLITLQKLDNTINSSLRERKVLSEERAGLATEQERVKAMVDELQNQIDSLEEQRVELSNALTRESANILRAENRLPEIKTQKEYVAVLKEIDTAKRITKEKQDQVKAKDEAIAALAEDKTEKDEAFAALSAKGAQRDAEIAVQLDSFDQEMAEHNEHRAELLKKLPAAVRKRYQMLLDRRAGLAVVAASAGACLGCNMKLPPQLFNSLFLLQSIESCPHCNRLIYVNQDS